MSLPDRRRVERHRVDLPGELHLAHGRRLPVRIVNLGVLGALVAATDLEETIAEGDRVLLDHPLLEEGCIATGRARTAGQVVRVEMELSDAGVVRQLAVFFDGGAPPEA